MANGYEYFFKAEKVQDLAKRLKILHDEKGMLETIENAVLNHLKIRSEEGMSIDELVGALNLKRALKKRKFTR